jgi:CRISPR-associated protein Cas6
VYWEDSQPPIYPISDDVVDLAFDLRCRCLPIDHAYALFQNLSRVLPWISEPGVGVHPIHVADSGNGWMRPDRPGDLLHLSRRTKLILRLPRARVPDAVILTGRMLDIDGYPLGVEQAVVRSLTPISAIFSRYVVSHGDDEGRFLAAAADQLRGLGVAPKKMLCGRETQIGIPNGEMRARSLLVADLAPQESMALQLRGLGPGRELGCGLFIGHKDINAVKQTLD